MEFFAAASEIDAIAEIKADLSSALSIGKCGAFAVLNVEKAKLVIQAITNKSPTITHEPTRRIKSHSNICGYRNAEFAVANALKKAVLRTHPTDRQ